MKKLIILFILSFSFTMNLNAQTGVERQTVSSPSVLLDFPTGTTNGIILPALTTLPTSPANGTFLLDKGDSKVKMFQNGAWVELSAAGDIAAIVPYSGTVDNNKQAIIGSRTTKIVDGSGNYVDGAVDGALVLESPNKALVLPHVSNPQTTVKSPYPGMMCYDTVSKSLAVFDGKVWNFWK